MVLLHSTSFVLHVLLLSSSGVASASTPDACSSSQQKPSTDGSLTHLSLNDFGIEGGPDNAHALGLVQTRASVQVKIPGMPGDSSTNPALPIGAAACDVVPGLFYSAAAYNEAQARFNSGLFVEIGAFLGQSSCYMSQRLMEMKKDDIEFDVIDYWGPVDPSFHWVKTSTQPELYDEMLSHGPDAHDTWSYFMHKSGSFERLRHVTQGSSRDPAVVNAYEDGSITFMFLDTSHTLKDTKEELELWWPKIKSGGMLCGDDYNEDSKPGHSQVAPAVKDSGIPFRLVYSKRPGKGFISKNFCMDKP